MVTGEEIQFDPNGEDNKRGLAGAVALYHIAAAAAREGKSLDEVAEIAQHYADNMASITVKSTDATHPQNGMSFGDLGETDLMEIGAGQHGEGGGVRVPMMSAKETVATVAEALSKNLDLKAGDKAFVMINGCGATTMMEMLVLFKDTVEFLKAKGVEVVASMVGEILTVQEAGGFQMNIAKWDRMSACACGTPPATPPRTARSKPWQMQSETRPPTTTIWTCPPRNRGFSQKVWDTGTGAQKTASPACSIPKAATP